jgi:hypothetical protein
MATDVPSVWLAGASRRGGEEAAWAGAGADAEFLAQVEAGGAAALAWRGPGGFLQARAVPEAVEVVQPLVGLMAAGALPG